ncbi:unnamed protein product [Bursaphelenchus okinawaensis]|uniref:Class II aldolase/adducin N-terminal domain-containing protein n=1 Tax=Bursaphelenchus okinawaensis TaxID=465554 RepID=A0A811JRM4_9BILA|nr:unnamed protein product [Bursaphelenchus okinawaensis]CAG9079903.1 unnamed protein product [Bursaphelenchus okinawaensis]
MANLQKRPVIRTYDVKWNLVEMPFFRQPMDKKPKIEDLKRFCGKEHRAKERKTATRSVYLTYFEANICKLCGNEVKSLTASMAQRHLRRNHSDILNNIDVHNSNEEEKIDQSNVKNLLDLISSSGIKVEDSEATFDEFNGQNVGLDHELLKTDSEGFNMDSESLNMGSEGVKVYSEGLKVDSEELAVDSSEANDVTANPGDLESFADEKPLQKTSESRKSYSKRQRLASTQSDRSKSVDLIEMFTKKSKGPYMTRDWSKVTELPEERSKLRNLSYIVDKLDRSISSLKQESSKNRSKKPSRSKNSKSTGDQSKIMNLSELAQKLDRSILSLPEGKLEKVLMPEKSSLRSKSAELPENGLNLTDSLIRLLENDEDSNLSVCEDCLTPSSSHTISPPATAWNSLFSRKNGQNSLGIGSNMDERQWKIKTNRALVVELMNKFYDLGWVFGSGGAMCLRDGPEDDIFVTPSAVQKDRLSEEDMGVVSPLGEVLLAPEAPNVISSCFKLFSTIFATHEQTHSHNVLNSVIHSHSVESNLMASFPTESPYKAVRFDTEEMLKGIINRSTGRPYSNTEPCLIPVIENAPSEGAPEFSDRIREAMTLYPECSAVLVRNHGAFYFGRDWKETKIMAEIFEYLFKLNLEKIKFAPNFKNEIFVF